MKKFLVTFRTMRQTIDVVHGAVEVYAEHELGASTLVFQMFGYNCSVQKVVKFDEDFSDAEMARVRLKQIEAEPDSLVRGKELNAKLNELLS